MGRHYSVILSLGQIDTVICVERKRCHFWSAQPAYAGDLSFGERDSRQNNDRSGFHYVQFWRKSNKCLYRPLLSWHCYLTSAVWADGLTLEGNSDANIYLDSAQNSRITNFFTQGADYGIIIVNGGQQNFFDQGVIQNAENNGIAINHGVHNFINNVLIKNSGQSGVYIDGGSTNNSIQHSFIWANGKVGPGTAGIEIQNALLTRY